LWIDEDVTEEAREETDKDEYVRFFHARFSNGKNVLSQLLLAHPEFGRFQPHADNAAARVKQTELIRIAGSDDIFNVRVEWSTLLIPEDKNPLERPADVDYSEDTRIRVTTQDGEGDPILNTAGDLLDDPPIEIDDPDLIISIAKNVPVKLPRWLRTYRRSVNADAVTIEGETYAPMTLRLKLKSLSKKQTENDVDFRALAFELHFREDGWQAEILNRGYYELVPAGRTPNSTGSGDFQGQRLRTKLKFDRVRIKVGWPPEYPAEPVPLDINGRKVEQRDSQGNLIRRPTVDNLVILKPLPFQKLQYTGVLPLK
jgi:hypothetical protein